MTKDTKLFIKDIALTTLVLVIIAVVAGGILTGVYAATKMTPEEKAAAKLSSIYESPKGFEDIELPTTGISSKDGKIEKVVVPKDGNGDVIIIASGQGAYKKTISIAVIINNYEIKDIKKYASGETPGLGENAFKKDHYKQYLGKFDENTKFVLKKKDPSGKVDAVTAATKTSTAFNNAVNIAIRYYIDNIDIINGKIGGASK